MATFEFVDPNTNSWEFVSDRILVRREILRGDLVSYADRSRSLEIDSAVVRFEIEGVWESADGQSYGAERIWQYAVSQSIGGSPLELTPDLQGHPSVVIPVHPVPGEGPSYYKTEQGDDERTRRAVFESASTYTGGASIWEDLDDLGQVL